MTLEVRLWTSAVVFAVAFASLGRLVSTGWLHRLDLEGSKLRGRSTRLARIFTRSGRSLPLLVLGSISLLATLVLKKPMWIPLAIFASQLLSQGVVEAVKRSVVRERPDEWLVHHERGFSFPSGHATTAIVFFGGWLLVLMLSPMSPLPKLFCATVLVLWIIGIDWSRLALGAHYLSDVLGGTCFGSAWSCAMLAFLIHVRAVPSL